MKTTQNMWLMQLKNMVTDFKESIYDLEHPKVTRNEFTRWTCWYCQGHEMNSGIGINHLKGHLQEYQIQYNILESKING